MSDWKDKVKNLQPKKKEGSSSITGLGLRDKATGASSVTGLGLRSKAGGLIGRGGNDAALPSTTHVARPRSELRDPASFPPPPKRGNSQPSPLGPTAAYSATLGPAHSNVTPDPLPQARIAYGQQQEDAEEAAPHKPWQMDSTGLSTAHLPPPPIRRDTADGKAPPPPYSSFKTPSAPGGGGPPSLPPRLPPRSGAGSPAQTQSPAWPSRPTVQTQGAMNRLGAAGISVPGLGIGKSSSTPPPPPPPSRSPFSTTPSSPQAASAGGGHMSELQSRFSRFGTSSSPQNSPTTTTSPSTQGGGGGTTLAQKQSAFRTASNFHKDPSSVSFSDARAAASTANNFRERHGEQVAGGLRAANGLGQRFGVTERASFGGDAAGGAGSAGNQSPASALGSVLGKKKPAPPPPRKKAELSSIHGTGNHGGEPPPPVPLATRPTF